jgi:hypothetical protein
MTNTTENFALRGVLKIVVRDAATGAIKRTQVINNQITYLFATILTELVCQRSTDPAPLQDALYSMRMGTGTNQPTRSDVNLQAYVIGYALPDVNKVTLAPGEITLIATMPSTDGNGSTFSEAGLFSGGTAMSTSDTPGTAPGTTRMIARQVYSPIAKTSAVTIDFSWTLLFNPTP